MVLHRLEIETGTFVPFSKESILLVTKGKNAEVLAQQALSCKRMCSNSSKEESVLECLESFRLF